MLEVGELRSGYGRLEILQGVTLHAHVVESIANALTETIVHP